MFWHRRLFSKPELEEIRQSIHHAELETTGEIRVYFEPKDKGDAYKRGVEMLHNLKLHEKKHRNGVMLYVAYQSKTFAIVGDEGIHKTVPENFWDDIKIDLQNCFKEGKMKTGIITAIEKVGSHLKQYFPNDGSGVTDSSTDLTIK